MLLFLFNYKLIIITIKVFVYLLYFDGKLDTLLHFIIVKQFDLKIMVCIGIKDFCFVLLFGIHLACIIVL